VCPVRRLQPYLSENTRGRECVAPMTQACEAKVRAAEGGWTCKSGSAESEGWVQV
jgi:hypothetical protein